MRILGEFERRGDRIERRFTGAERRMIGNLAGGMLRTLETADELAGYDDPVLARLLPVAAPDDPDASAEFASATRGRLVESKADGARRLVADLDAAPGGVLRLDADDAVVWVKALGDVRIALAERVGIEAVQGGHGPQSMIYGWLTWLQGSLVEVLDEDAEPDAG